MNRSIPFVLGLLAIVAACDANNSTGPQVGTVKGNIVDTLQQPLVGVRVVVYPFTGDSTVLHTSSTGSWQVNNVSIGTGEIAVESLPPDCDTVGSVQFFLASPGTSATVNLQIACSQSHQVVVGRGDFDGGAINQVRRNRTAARRVGLKYRVDGVSDTPRRVGHVILDGRAIALTRVAPVALRHERLL
jgi:hypothetical protein